MAAWPSAPVGIPAAARAVETASATRPAPLITTWKLSGYGEAGKNALKPARSMEEATVLAMRDAAATISMELAAQPGIDQLLREKSDASTDENN